MQQYIYFHKKFAPIPIMPIIHHSIMPTPSITPTPSKHQPTIQSFLTSASKVIIPSPIPKNTVVSSAPLPPETLKNPTSAKDEAKSTIEMLELEEDSAILQPIMALTPKKPIPIGLGNVVTDVKIGDHSAAFNVISPEILLSR